jgi:LacI family transcriptional regulator
MPLKEGAVVTIKEVAARAGVSLATVSYALRNDPMIGAATRQRVVAAALELGYRPNPRVAGLMAHIRRGHLPPPGESIAFVWVHTARAESREDPFLCKVFGGARRRAEQMGFGLEEFWTADPGMTDRRLQEIIRARGIVGVVLSPVVNYETEIELGWDWAHFAAAVIGNATWKPELHHAGHHHYLGMRMALLELARLGCTRPAALIEAATHERSKHAYWAAFVGQYPEPTRALSLIRIVEPNEAKSYAPWLEATAADALIVTFPEQVQDLGLEGICRKRGIPVVTLLWDESQPNIGGIDQGFDYIAGYAVELVALQINNNEFGVPERPRMMLLPGRWIAPSLTGRRIKPRARPLAQEPSG